MNLRVQQGNVYPCLTLDALSISIRQSSTGEPVLDCQIQTSFASSCQAETAVPTPRMLAMNYRLMDAWYQVSRRFSTEAARRALEDMSLVVAHFANVMGERSACAAAA